MSEQAQHEREESCRQRLIACNLRQYDEPASFFLSWMEV